MSIYHRFLIYIFLVFNILNFLQPNLKSQIKDSSFQKSGISSKLPVFIENQIKQMNYSLSWLNGNWNNFDRWKNEARNVLIKCLLRQPPSAPFNPVIISEEDRKTYTAKKVVFNLTADSRVLSYLLIPKGKGPFPAVLLLHDHGARFDIGKEKVIEPFVSDIALRDTARKWVEKFYDGRFLGDELARRGYVCLAIDAFNWGNRAGGSYEDQQAIAANLLNLGMSYAGLIAWEDIASAEFLASLDFVDSNRIAAMGFSFGGFRSWQLAALSERISCSVSFCWMGTNHGLLKPGNNRTLGYSAFTTTHPDLANYLDFPDVASIACPKPMLFINGKEDKLFPIETVKEAFEKMQLIWKSQAASEHLKTELWDVRHLCTSEMQEYAFQWLDKYLKVK